LLLVQDSRESFAPIHYQMGHHNECIHNYHKSHYTILQYTMGNTMFHIHLSKSGWLTYGEHLDPGVKMDFCLLEFLS
jgi:hypothetical protein